MELREVLPWLVVLVVILATAYKSYKEHKNFVASLTEAMVAVRSDPVALVNAQTAAASIPQEAFDGLYDLMNGLLTFLKDTAVGQLIQDAKESVELIDKDPNNDPIGSVIPVPTVKSPVIRVGSNLGKIELGPESENG